MAVGTGAVSARLGEAKRLLDGELDSGSVQRLLALIGLDGFPMYLLDEIELYSEHVPKAVELGFSRRQKMLHFLWDSLDKTSVCLAVNYAIPFRRMIAERLFAKCGKNFIAEENVRFNLGQNLRIGDDVFINRGTYLDTKGGITLGDYSGLGEGVTIFTHSHSESVHSERTYGEVVVGSYAKIYSYAVILPGVRIGNEAIVAGRAVVTKDVEEGMVVAGSPAVSVRKRRTDGRSGAELGHIWFGDGAFQKD